MSNRFRTPTDQETKVRVIVLTSAIFVAIILMFIIHWIGWSRYIESTDDAYVNGNTVQVTPPKAGIVTAIYADDTELVEVGQPLIQLDPHEFEVDLEKAKADLAEAVRDVEQMFLKVKELTAKQESSLAELFQANQDFHHRQALVTDGSVSVEDFEHSQVTLYSAYSSLKEVTQELESAKAQVENTTVATHPRVEQAKSALRSAYLAWHRTTVLAPVRGIVTQRKAQLGGWVQATDPLLWIVPLDQIWVDANFRESDLKHVRIGQPVELVTDMYGNAVIFKGQVMGINPGTGSVFSVLPPQNASGNWIKIIQRIPVRISLNESRKLKKYPLILGLSVTASVDTSRRSGLRLPKPNSKKAVYQTDIYEKELEGSNELIEKIIAENMYCS